MKRRVLFSTLPILRAVVLALIPLVLVLSGAFYIALGSELFMRPLIKADDFPYELPSPSFAYLGILLVILGLGLAVYLIRFKFVASFGWIMALVTQAVILTVVLIVLISPWFDILVLNISFNKGACKTLGYLINRRADSEYKTQALEELNTFCASASRLFGYTYSP